MRKPWEIGGNCQKKKQKQKITKRWRRSRWSTGRRRGGAGHRVQRICARSWRLKATRCPNTHTLQVRGKAFSPLRSSRPDGRKCVCCTGTYFAPHTHKVEKKDAVVSGRFKMTMFGNTFVLEAGDCLLVPPSSPSSRAASVLASLTTHRSPPEPSTPPRWWAMSLWCPWTRKNTEHE